MLNQIVRGGGETKSTFTGRSFPDCTSPRILAFRTATQSFAREEFSNPCGYSQECGPSCHSRPAG
jgi:hypothetical protein